MESVFNVLVLKCWPPAYLLTVFTDFFVFLMKPCTVSHHSFLLCLHFSFKIFSHFSMDPCLVFSLCLSLSLSPSLLTQFWDKAVDWWWHDSVECTALSGSEAALPSAVLTVLSWMNERSVLTPGATVSNNKTLFCSVKFYKLLDLVSLLGAQKTFKHRPVISRFVHILL